MAIQILGLRYFADKKSEKMRMHECFFNKKWRAESVADLFKNLEKHLELIPEDQRFNLYYTASDCHEERGRKLHFQSIIPYDVDGIDLSRIEDYIDPVLHAIGDLNYSDVGIVYSGNGLQFIVDTRNIIEDTKWFDENRFYYQEICGRVDKELAKLNLPGKADPSVFSPARLLRLPETKNIKTPETGYAKKNSTVHARLQQRILNKVDYDLVKIAGVPYVDPKAGLTAEEIKKFGKPDTEYILKECGFLQHCSSNQDRISEEDWYKMLSVTARLDDTGALSHKMSCEHPEYDEAETGRKIEQAIRASGPRTCQNIYQTFPQCRSCPHFGKIKSPILLKSDEFLSTKDTGFRKIGKNGAPGAVHYDELVKFFEQEHKYCTTYNKSTYIFNGKFWELYQDIQLKAFCEQWVNPAPKDNERREFVAKIQCNNLVPNDYFENTTFKMMNLNNGVLDMSNGEPVLHPHSTNYGFRSVLPYDYDPNSKCPRFDQFMDEVTLGNESLKQILLEYAGYAFANEECTTAKALIMTGEGSNGKSTFIETLQHLAGKDAYSSVSIDKLNNDQYTARLVGKLFNIMEETPKKAFLDSSSFKNLVSGGDINVKVVYKEPYEVKNRAKLIISCNDLPYVTDTSHGMYRRLLIVPFDASFEKEKGNKDKEIKSKLFKESSGILNRIVEGFYRFKSQGDFTESDAITRKLDEYKEDNNPLIGFSSDFIAEGEENKVLVADIFSRFQEYCVDNNYKYVPNSAQFSKELKRQFPSIKRERVSVHGKQQRVFVGIGLKDINTEF